MVKRPGNSAAKVEWEKLMRGRKAILAWHKMSLAQLARLIGRSEYTIGTVVNRYPEKKSRYVQESIAKILNEPYEKLWCLPSPNHESIVPDIKRTVND